MNFHQDAHNTGGCDDVTRQSFLPLLRSLSRCHPLPPSRIALPSSVGGDDKGRRDEGRGWRGLASIDYFSHQSCMSLSPPPPPPLPPPTITSIKQAVPLMGYFRPACSISALRVRSSEEAGKDNTYIYVIKHCGEELLATAGGHTPYGSFHGGSWIEDVHSYRCTWKHLHFLKCLIYSHADAMIGVVL